MDTSTPILHTVCIGRACLFCFCCFLLFIFMAAERKIVPNISDVPSEVHRVACDVTIVEALS